MTSVGFLKRFVDLPALAARYTRLKRWSVGEMAGPCPKCGGKDRFHVHANGWWFCRQCHEKRGDAFDLLQWLGLAPDFGAAVALLKSIGGNPIALPVTPKREPDGDAPGWRDPAWQQWAQGIVQAGIARLTRGDRDGYFGREYLRKRGLEPATWKRFNLGYSLKRGRGAIIIPWLRRGVVEGVFYRFLSGEQRYGGEARSERRLFGLDVLQGRPILLIVEGEINAMSLWQEAGDLADVLSFGGEGALQRIEIVQELREIASRYRYVLLWLDDPQRAAAARKALEGLNVPVAAMRSPEADGRKLDANECLQVGSLRPLILSVFERLGLREPGDDLVSYATQELGATIVEAQWSPEHLPAPVRALYDALRASLDDLEARQRKGRALLEVETDQAKRERYTRRLAEIAALIERTRAEIARLTVNS